MSLRVHRKVHARRDGHDLFLLSWLDHCPADSCLPGDVREPGITESQHNVILRICRDLIQERDVAESTHPGLCERLVFRSLVILPDSKITLHFPLGSHVEPIGHIPKIQVELV